MSISPSGFMPIVTRYCGYLLLAYAAYGLIFILGEFANSSTNDMNEFAVGIAFALVYVMFLYGLGRMLVSAFPTVIITNEGVRFHYLTVFRGTVYWDEVVEVRRLQLQDALAIVVRRPGHRWITPRGLFYQKWHGYLVNRAHPAILIRPSREICNQVYAELS